MENEISNGDQNALLTLLQSIRSNTEFYMRQQWAVTNYAFLLYGAIIGIMNLKLLETKIGCNEKIFASIISTLMCAFAIILIVLLNSSLQANRKMVDDIYDQIPILKKITEKSPPKTSLTWLFIVLLIVGELTVLWILSKI